MLESLMENEGASGEALFGPGTNVDQFRVIRLLGEGGMGAVYLARDTRLGRKVALKVVRPSSARSEAEIKRLLFEAKTTARFSHPHIVTVYASGVCEGYPYLALEYLDGESLRERIGAQKLSVMESARVALEIASALEEAHRHNVLHRDLKPENVLIPKDGRLRVVDFGLAKVMPRTMPTSDESGEPGRHEPILISTPVMLKSKGGELQGTPHYMAPEQWMGRKSIAATDVWALGIMLFEFITSKRPFEDDTLVGLATLVSGPEPAPSLVGLPGVSKELATLVSKCLSKSPRERPSAKEVAKRLRLIIAPERTRPPGKENPFRGLQTFGERHADLFFGREEEVVAFLERLREEPVLPLVGPSGAGKSSFVAAGVIPRLREQGSWTVIRFRPGSHPFKILASRLNVMMPLEEKERMVLQPTMEFDLKRGSDEEGDPPEEGGRKSLPLDLQLQQSPQFLALLLDMMATRLNRRVLLFVDQLEEIYTLVDDEQVRRSFMDAICNAADEPSEPIRVIFTVREDFISRLPGGPLVSRALSHVSVLRPPEPDALEEILVKPLQALGYGYEDSELVSEIIEDAGQEQALLPLLQFTARMLWERRDKERRILTRESYTAIGGVAGALAAHADGVLEGLSEANEELVREILLRLVTPEGARRVLSLERTLEGLHPLAKDMLARLIKARLISVRKSRVKEEGDDPAGAVLELVHESLVTSWARLARWIERSREDLAFLYEAGQQAEIWQKRGRREDEVWSGEALTEALRALDRCSEKVPHRVIEFLEAGQQRRARQVRRRRILLSLGAVLVALIIVVLLYQKEQAKLQRREARKGWAEAQREGARAAVMRGDLLEARAKLRGSLETQDSPLARSLWWRLNRDPLVWKKELPAVVFDVAFSPNGEMVAAACQNQTVYLFDVKTRTVRPLWGHQDQVLSVAFSPDSTRLASGTWSGKVNVWNLVDHTSRTLSGHGASIWGLSFGPRGRFLATASADRTARIWDLRSRNASRVLRGHKGQVFKVSFSKDGKRLATSSNDFTLRVWDVETGRVRAVLDKDSQGKTGHSAGVYGVAFSPDGKRLASGSYDLSVRLWNLKTGAQERVLRGHSSFVMSVAFSPDGKRLASGSYDRTLRLWDLRSGETVKVFKGHSDIVSGLGFSPDGQHLVSGSRDRTIRVWDLASQISTRVIRGHGSAVFGASFNPAGTVLATGGGDRMVRLWDVKTGQQLKALHGHQAKVRGVAFSPDGKLLASGSRDDSVRLWNLQSGGKARILGTHLSGVNSVTFSPDGKLLATAGQDWAVRLWDVKESIQQRKFKGHHKGVNDVRFSPDGKLLASGGMDQTIRLWDLGNPGQQGRLLKGHAAQVKGVGFSPDGSFIFSAGIDRSVRKWDLATGISSRLQSPESGRAYFLDVHPAGEMVGVPYSDGTAALINLNSGDIVRLRGHQAEVNFLRFSPDGRLVATTSDDGTVRLWHTDSGRPYWRAPVMLSSPPRIHTQQGWVLLGGGEDDSAESPWKRAIEQRARVADETTDGTLLCLQTDRGELELWDMHSDQRLLSKEVGRARQVLAMDSGCLLLLESGVRLVERSGKEREIHKGATAMAWENNQILVAAGQRIYVYDVSGVKKGSHEVGAGVRAMTRSGAWLALGFENGNIEIIPTVQGKEKPDFSFEDVPSAPVVSMLEGPSQTLLVGYANGLLGIWNMNNGVRLDFSRLHGSVVHMLRKRNKLYAATALGDHLVQDLGAFHIKYCDLMRQVWQKVPVLWSGGMPVLSAAPQHHRCARP